MRRRDWLKSIVALAVTATSPVAKAVTATPPAVIDPPWLSKMITKAVMLGGPMHGRYAGIGSCRTYCVPVRNDDGEFSISVHEYRLFLARDRQCELKEFWLYCGAAGSVYPAPEAITELKRWRASLCRIDGSRRSR